MVDMADIPTGLYVYEVCDGGVRLKSDQFVKVGVE